MALQAGHLLNDLPARSHGYDQTETVHTCMLLLMAGAYAGCKGTNW